MWLRDGLLIFSKLKMISGNQMLTLRPKDEPLYTGLETLVESLQTDVVMAEIGCYRGESTEVFCRKAKTIYAVDPWLNYGENNPGGVCHMTDFKNVEKEFDALVKRYPDVIKKVKAESLEAVFTFPNECLDFVYLDALHEFGMVLADIRVWLPKIKHGGIIGGHDYVNDFHPGVKEAVDATFGKPDKIFLDTSWLKHL